MNKYEQMLVEAMSASVDDLSTRPAWNVPYNIICDTWYTYHHDAGSPCWSVLTVHTVYIHVTMFTAIGLRVQSDMQRQGCGQGFCAAI